MLLAPACTRRERSNPLDPSNPVTGGRPEGFDAIAGYSSVSLRWTPRADLAIDGFQLFRRAVTDSAFIPLGGLQPASSQGFLDSGTLNGRDYRYRLHYVVGGQLSATPAEDIATPGPLRPWVCDPGNGVLVRLSADGRDIAARYDVGITPYAIAVSIVDGSVWVSDPFSGLALRLDPVFLQGVQMVGLSQPFQIALDQVNASAWITDLTGALGHYFPNGQPATPGRIDLLQSPGGVAVNGNTRELFVCETGGNRVRRYSNDGTPLGSGNVPAPSRVAIDSVTRFAWVTSLPTGRVYQLNEAAQVLDSLIGASGPIGIAVDSRRRRIWVADAVGNQVMVFDADSKIMVFRVTGLGEPKDVDVDLATGDAYVVARAERSVVHLSASGAIVARRTGFSDPYELGLDPGQ
ncbi:MAG: hypothetical protein ABIR01_04340 [Candidatus Eisenbacteria bacterium]